MEKHVCEHLYSYFTTNELLCLNQSGFRKNHSCHTCLVNLIEECYKDLNDNNLIGLLALDFRKAFDILNHEVLLKKLSLYGCNKLAVTWFKSYLTNRVQSVKIEDVSLKNCIVEDGVPQGSILGPLLFVIFINDMPLHCSECTVHLYADDSTLKASKLSIDLVNIENWCANNRFVINTQKSNFMITCSYQKRKYILLDNSLTWNLHINNVCNKLSSLIGLFYKIHKFLDFSSKVLFYNSYILPRIDYCLSICGDAPIDTLLRLFRLQKRVARLILDVH